MCIATNIQYFYKKKYIIKYEREKEIIFYFNRNDNKALTLQQLVKEDTQ